MEWVYDDGGRCAAGFRGHTYDCVVRSVAIATGRPYAEVYQELNAYALAHERRGKRNGKSSARTGVRNTTTRRYIESLGWVWHPCMGIGTGCRVHLHDGELPMGRLLVSVSKHVTAVIDGVIYDIGDPQRATLVCENGEQRIARRCVYGYWTEPESCHASKSG